MIIYLDNSATTRQYENVTNAMVDIMNNNYGNPSSLHTMGVAAERAVSEARQRVAKQLKVPADEVYFTSGGTEGNNLAITGVYNALRIKGEVVSTMAEHKSISEPLKKIENVNYLNIDSNGQISMGELESVINERTSLVSIMHVNNETGAISPVAEIGRIIKAKNPNCLFHIDAVQSYCKLDLPKTNADLITVSAHKIHGPKGIGAIYIKKGVKVSPLIHGGGQEKNIRSGTENTAAIVGFGVATQAKADINHIKKLNDILRERLENVIFNCIDGSPYILNFSALGIRSEILLHSLEQRGVMVSSGSACSSNKPSPSHVLTAMRLKKEVIDSSIRISFSMQNTVDEIIRASEIINDVISNLRRQLGRN